MKLEFYLDIQKIKKKYKNFLIYIHIEKIIENIFCYICDHKFTDQEIINNQFNICNNPNCNNLLCDYCDVRSTIMINENNEIICNCNNVIEIMNNMDVFTAPLTDDNYDDMDTDSETCKIFFSDDF